MQQTHVCCSLTLLFSTKLVESRKIYNKMGQFDYKGKKYTEDLKEYIGKNDKENKCIYIGQVKKGTEILDGIGICVWDHGATINN